MFNLFKKKSDKKEQSESKSAQEQFKAFGTGKIVALENVPDQVFSQRIMGDGFAIDVADGAIYAPVSGNISMIFPTGHALGLVTEDGTEVLLHLGIDTVELNGAGFKGVVKQGDDVKQGDLLTTMDLESIREAGKSTISMLIFTSGQKIQNVQEGLEVTPESDSFFEFV